MQVPRITKITVNMGVGEAVADRKIVDAAAADLAKITGQKPLITKSKKAIASFKLRENLPIGCKVTLRGARMYEFLDRLITIAMPRIRDFRGVSARAFDGRGNYTLGVQGTDHFPRDPVRPDRPAAWHGHHHHHDRARPTNRVARCSKHSISRSASNAAHRGKTAWPRQAWSNARSTGQQTVKKYAASARALRSRFAAPRTSDERAPRRSAAAAAAA